MMRAKAPNRTGPEKLPECRADYCRFSRVATIECVIVGLQSDKGVVADEYTYKMIA